MTRDYDAFSYLVNSRTVIAFSLGTLVAVSANRIRSRYFCRIRSAEWVSAKMMTEKRWIKGVVTSVGDGDGFRLYHTPGLFWRWPIKLRHIPAGWKSLKDETIHIRMAGIDAPESAHFGKPAQPYSAEALAWLKNEIEGKRLWVQIIRRDQYNRIVGIPVHPPCIPLIYPLAFRCVSIAMLSAGYVITYEQSGAEFGRWGKDLFLKYESTAKAARRGMWASPVPLESPAEYKKRHRDATTIKPVKDFQTVIRPVKDILPYWGKLWTR